MYSILIYGFPLTLLLFEWGLRSLLAVDSWGFTGPTLAAAGLSFLVPLTKPKILNVAIAGMPDAVAISKGDNQFIAFIWLLVLAFLFIWSGACYASIKYPDHMVLGVSTHLVV